MHHCKLLDGCDTAPSYSDSDANLCRKTAGDKSEHTGRNYFACPKSESKCSFFMWEDVINRNSTPYKGKIADGVPSPKRKKLSSPMLSGKY